MRGSGEPEGQRGDATEKGGEAVQSACIAVPASGVGGRGDGHSLRLEPVEGSFAGDANRESVEEPK